MLLIFINFIDYKMYIETVANVYRGKLIGIDMHDKFSDFVNLVASKLDLLKRQEADLGEIPDEFMGMIVISLTRIFISRSDLVYFDDRSDQAA
jgi:hypothetical protein